MFENCSILQVGKYYAPHKGGFETHLQTLSKGLQNHVQVRVVVAAKNGTEGHPEDGVHVDSLPTLFHLAGAPVCPALNGVFRSAAEDLIHIHHPNPYAMISWLRSENPAPLVVSYHSEIVRQKFTGRLFEPILRKVLQKSAAIIVSSEALLLSSMILSEFKEKCHVIPWGIDLERFDEPEDQQVFDLRKRFGPRIVLAVGRFVYYKGFEYLIRAMNRVDATLLMIGSGPLYSTLKSLANGVSARIHLIGEVDDASLVNYYHASDVFVLPSIATSEAFGFVQLEAMACGKPVINTQLESGVPEVSLDGVTGITVPPKDETNLAASIKKLLDDTELAKRYGTAGKKRVQSFYTVGRMVRQTLDLYQKIL